MPRELTLLRKDPDLVANYCAAFGREDKLKQAHAGPLVFVLIFAGGNNLKHHSAILVHGHNVRVQVGFSFITAHSKDLFGKK